jgi:Skp family chaperone for outer membrane proteins
MSGKSKIHIFALCLVLSVFLSTAVLAQGTAAATPTAAAPASAATSTKIGIVNIQDAIMACNEGKKEIDALNSRFGPKQTELKQLNDEVDNLKKQLQANGDKLSEEERGTRMKTLETKQKTLQRNFDDAQTEYQQASQEIVNRIGSKMLNVLEKYANTNGYAVVLDVSSPQTPVLWAAQGTNITKELVEAYNAEAPSTPSAPAPKTGAPATRPSGTARPPAAGTTPKKP